MITESDLYAEQISADVAGSVVCRFLKAHLATRRYFASRPTHSKPQARMSQDDNTIQEGGGRDSVDSSRLCSSS